ncbi:MAG: ABC transporter substrate-binding protein [Pseudoflavonifractor sp.]|nr:ABC transporter substrate-binding protein [Alloprevotella sp.]MCM1117095.1 ABC transporter substrate-binding protein [Pseudoflavonifractor sp.]
MTPRTAFFSTVIATVLPLLCACNGGNTASSLSAPGDTIELTYARNLEMIDHGDFTAVTIRNPWDTTRTLARYILLPRGTSREGLQTDGYTIVEVPLQRTVIYTSTHNNLLAELGAASSIAGACGTEYIHDSTVVAMLHDGRVTDCGNPMAPDFEKIIALNPDGILFSSMDGNHGQGKLGQLGIPLIECADYMEPSPLARAEWMRFFGRLVGRALTADSLFAATATQYNTLKHKASATATRPLVILDRLFNGVWNVPGARSTMGQMLADAGARNPFSYIDRAGSAPISPEQALDRAHDADFWLIRYNLPQTLTLDALNAESPLYRQLGPWAKGNIYGCNTSVMDLYDKMPFHPQLALADIISVVHPETGVTSPSHYFTPLK